MLFVFVHKNVSQLLLVRSGYHTHIFQYADNSRQNMSVLHYSWKDVFQSGESGFHAEKKNCCKFSQCRTRYSQSRYKQFAWNVRYQFISPCGKPHYAEFCRYCKQFIKKHEFDEISPKWFFDIFKFISDLDPSTTACGGGPPPLSGEVLFRPQIFANFSWIL